MTERFSTFRRTLTVSSDPSRLAEVRRFVETVCTLAGVSPERTFDLKVAVSEACANAVEHASQGDRPLEVRAWRRAGRLTIDICDHGGFRLPCTANGAQRDHRGLGLPLMVALTDEVRITRLPTGGTRVTLSISLAQRDGRPSAPAPGTHTAVGPY